MSCSAAWRAARACARGRNELTLVLGVIDAVATKAKLRAITGTAS